MTAVDGEVGGVKAEVYKAVPLIALTSDMNPCIPTLPVLSAAMLRGKFDAPKLAVELP